MSRKIALYIDQLSGDQKDWSLRDESIYQLVRHLLQLNPEWSFLILSSIDLHQLFPREDFPPIKLVVLKETSFVLSADKARFFYQIPQLLKKEKVDLYLSFGGILSPKIKIPCYYVMTDLPRSSKKGRKTKGYSTFFRKKIKKSLAHALKLFVFSQAQEQKLAEHAQVDKNKIIVLPKAISENFVPIGWNERREVKTDFARGREFIVAFERISEESNIVPLLKGFTLLKKKMHSDMLLVIVGRKDSSYQQFSELFETYHFRKEVILLDEVEEDKIPLLLASAYAVVVSSAENEFHAIPFALKSLTPVVAEKSVLNEEVGGDYILYYPSDDFQELGNQLCEIYKDEELRSSLIKRMEAISSFSGFEAQALRIWETLNAAIPEEVK